jgi:hypothetical protein
VLRELYHRLDHLHRRPDMIHTDAKSHGYVTYNISLTIIVVHIAEYRALSKVTLTLRRMVNRRIYFF